MSAVTLYRIDNERHMHRFYRLDIQPDLFGGFTLVREFGRIDQPGQLRLTAFDTEDEAAAALTRLQRVKERRAYCAT